MISPEKTPQEKTPLARELAARISANGPITFSQYMGACLYDPNHGYYSSEKRTRFADYFTEPDQARKGVQLRQGIGSHRLRRTDPRRERSCKPLG